MMFGQKTSETTETTYRELAEKTLGTNPHAVLTEARIARANLYATLALDDTMREVLAELRDRP